MTEFLNRTWQSLGGSGGGAPASAGAGGVPPPPPQSQTLSNLQKGASIGSSILAIAGGASEARSLQHQAGDQIVASVAEETEAMRAANETRRAMLAQSARLRVAFAASGVDLGSGTVQTMDREIRESAEENITQTLARGMQRRSARRRSAKQLARRAAETFGVGLIGGATQAVATFGGG